MERLYRKRADGPWYGQFYGLDGKRRQVCTHAFDRANAQLVLNRIEREALVEARLPEDETAQLRNVLNAYLARCELRGRSEHTIAGYLKDGGHLVRVFGETTSVNQLPPLAEEKFIAQRLEEGASHHTIHKQLVLLRASLKLARRRGVFTGDLEKLRADHSPGYVPRRRFLTRLEYELLLSHVASKRRATLAFIVLSGARDSECRAVRREHVDFGSMLVLPGTKTKGSYRVIPLRDHTDLAELLKQVIAELPDGQQELFPPWSNIRRDLRDACNAAKIDRVSPNDLRRTFASWCWQAGMQPARIALLLGHRDARMVERVYGVLPLALVGWELGAVFTAMNLPKINSLPAGNNAPKSGNSAPENSSTSPRTPRPARQLPANTSDEEAQESREPAVPRAGIEPATRGFSVPCSTN